MCAKLFAVFSRQVYSWCLYLAVYVCLFIWLYRAICGGRAGAVRCACIGMDGWGCGIGRLHMFGWMGDQGLGFWSGITVSVDGDMCSILVFIGTDDWGSLDEEYGYRCV